MARAPTKHDRDQTYDFQGFLNDLQDWEANLNDKDKKLKRGEPSDKNIGFAGRSKVKSSIVGSSRSTSGKYDYSRSFDSVSHLSSFSSEDNNVDAASEKELGNEYFKQKKFKEAAECYSRSIALTPTAVAYANRAMAYLKMKRYQKAEEDCTEALNLDDRYIKAYSRRATARKELGKLKESIEDSEFALKLEPNNQEIKKQYDEVKSLYEKEILVKASGTLRHSLQASQKGEKSDSNVNSPTVRVISSDIERAGTSASSKDKTTENGKALAKKSVSVEEIEKKSTGVGRGTEGPHVSDSHPGATSAVQRNHKNGDQQLKASLQELASQAAARATAEAAKKIIPPDSAYQFEVSWKGFSGDCALQSRLLKVTSPAALPQIFKNALSAPLLMDIIKCLATIFDDDTDLTIKYLENLTKVPRFSMLIMCLSSAEKTDLHKIWDEVFCGEAVPMEHTEILNNLRPKYCLR